MDSEGEGKDLSKEILAKGPAYRVEKGGKKKKK